MAGRAWAWGGGVAATATAVALGIYFDRVGLDKADKLASAIGLFVALAGLAVSVYGIIQTRRSGQAELRPEVHNQITGGVQHGTIYQGRDFSIGRKQPEE
ncbi:hypothetical protein [Streptosporangium roseum]|uniref:hypothetical protein n=1 Tax=Streptosporangium roseum TaxID=2001 RepID=UPI0012DDF7AB|nr:hypothetical protein [Streptosporangium roseum]